MRRRGRRVVVTGAGGAIGRAIAPAFAAEGADLVLADVSAAVDAVAAEAREAHGRASSRPVDVTRSDDLTAMVRRALDDFGRRHVLVTCAGLRTGGLLTVEAPNVAGGFVMS